MFIDLPGRILFCKIVAQSNARSYRRLCLWTSPPDGTAKWITVLHLYKKFEGYGPAMRVGVELEFFRLEGEIRHGIPRVSVITSDRCFCSSRYSS